MTSHSQILDFLRVILTSKAVLDFPGGWTSLVTQTVSVCLQCRRPQVQSVGWDDLEKELAILEDLKHTLRE